VKMEADIDSLLMLRRRSERIALDDAVRSEAKLRRAERNSEEAERTVNEYLAASRSTERELTASLIGRAVSTNSIARLQMELDTMQAQADGLESEAAAARGVVAESRQLYDAASKRFSLRRRDVIKLELLAKRVKDQRGRRRRAVDEAVLEESAATRQANAPAEHE
jgi:hypothetical protein